MKKMWLAGLLAISLLSCNKENLESKLPPVKPHIVVNNLPVTLTIDENNPRYTIPQNFEGLSFETGILVDSPEFLNVNNKVLIQMIKNLGDGVLRIGGNSSDEINWAGTPQSVNYPQNSLTSYDIDRLADFDNAIGWRVIFGLNLGNNNGALAAGEAAYVRSKLPRLYLFQSGNEPDVFSLGLRPPKYSFLGFEGEWNNYFTAIRKQVPDAEFAGPDVNPFNSKWVTSFAAAEHQNIKMLDGHYYDTGPASLPGIAYTDILTENAKMAGYLGTLHTQAEQYKMPFRISECNSVFGQGKPGVSDVFASALWALDFMWQVAEYQGQGVNFHAGGQAFHYSPIGTKNGVFSAMPEYYAMLAFKQAAVGQTIVPAKLGQSDYNISAHACVNSDGTRSITLINEETQSSFAFTIQLTRPASVVTVARLTAPLISSAIGTTYAGSQVNADGTFMPNITEQYNVNGNSFVVNVPAGSAAVVMVQ